MIQLTTTIKSKRLAVPRHAKSVPNVIRSEMRRIGSRARNRTLSKMRQDPPKPRYPINWTSERQRKAYFATNGFGAGIPYQRTGRLNRSYNFAINDTSSGASIVISSSSRVGRYVVGTPPGNARKFQQRFHADRWDLVYPIARKELERVKVDAEKTIKRRLVEEWSQAARGGRL